MKKLFHISFYFISIMSVAQSGITWSPQINVASFTYDNMHPRIATDGAGNPLVIWGRTSDQSVFFSRWNGTAFTMPVKLNPTGINIATQSWMGPDIASKGDTVYVVMKRMPEVSDTSHIFLTRSVDGGMNFSPLIQVENIADSVSRFPAVTADGGGNPLVAFMKFDPMTFGNARWVVAKSTDLGNTFSTDVLASGWSGGTVCDCCPGAIVTENNNTFVLYRDNLSNLRDTWAGISTDGGNSFTQGIPVDQNNWNIPTCPATGPDGVIAGDTLYSVFMNGVSGMARVYLSKTPVTSLLASTGFTITGAIAGLSNQNYPRIANNGSSVAVAWKQGVNGVDQLAVKFATNIISGLQAGFDTVATGSIINADVAVDAGNVYVVWEDGSTGSVKFRKGTFSATAVEENNFQNLFGVIYNSPAAEIIIRSNAESNAGTRILISNASGQEVFSKTFSESGTSISISAEKWSAGVYFVTAESGNSRHTEKISVQGK